MTNMIEQRSPEWFAQRKGRITASMVGAILGNSPYMTRAQAMRSMVRDYLGAEREFKGNPATQYGTLNEKGAVIDFTMETGMKVEPAPFVMFEDWAGASPDGYVSDGSLIEIKCPYGLRNTAHPVPFKLLAQQPHYYDQVQFQLLCTSYDKAYFFQWCQWDTMREVVLIDQEWRDRNIPRLKQFYAEFLDEVKTNADEHLHQPIREEIDSVDAHRMIREWDELNDQLGQLEERKKDLLAQIVALAGSKNATIAGRKLTLTKKAGSISYAKAIKALAPNADLEPYRGKESQFWGIR